MRDLVALLTPQEEIDVENALRNLYTFQDKPLKKETLALFIQEITHSGKPFNAILAGLDSLKKENLNRITMPEIMHAVDQFVEKAESQAVPCHECMSGYIVTKDEEGRNFALACTCTNGDRVMRQGNVRRNGKSTQSSKGRTLTQ